MNCDNGHMEAGTQLMFATMALNYGDRARMQKKSNS